MPSIRIGSTTMPMRNALERTMARNSASATARILLRLTPTPPAARCARRCRASEGRVISNCCTLVRAASARKNACGSPETRTSCMLPWSTTLSTPGMPSSAARPPSVRTRMVSAPYWAWISASVPSSTFLPRKIMKMRSQSRSAVAMSCVEKTMVVPRSRSASTASLSTSAFTGSRPLNGSSRISSSGSETTAAMNCTFCDCPFDSDSILRPARSASCRRSSQASMAPSRRARGTDLSRP